MNSHKPLPSLEEALGRLASIARQVSEKGKSPIVVRRILELEQELRRILLGGTPMTRDGSFNSVGPVKQQPSKLQRGPMPKDHEV
jgi:hypothetical protein